MTKYSVQGGKPLFGEVEISGAKNAAVAIIPAALMVDGVCRVENLPQISDVTMSLKILENLGAQIRTINRHTVEIDSTHIHSTRTDYELARKIRASYYLIGALLDRFGHGEVAMPGGCNFGGVRPIDLHVKGFTALGAKVTVCAKRYEDLAWAAAYGCDTLRLETLSYELGGFDLIVNTIPARVLSPHRLSLVNPEAFILDLASAPGGVDQRAAKELGLRVLQAPGLPGRTAPVTAAAAIRDAVYHILWELEEAP